MLFDMVAPCYFGTERAAAFDFKNIGAQDIAVSDGRISFRGDETVAAAANLWSRCTERILICLKRFPARTFDELFDGVSSIPWEELMPADAAFPVKGSSLSSTLSSVPACQSIVKKAVVERLKRGHKTAVLPEDGALYKLRFSLRRDTAEIFLDTSGEGLHKRGYRRTSVDAPIKETLAAAIADCGRVYPDTRAQDPFCGSGTLLIEAALKAMNAAPGLHRRFLGEQYAFLPAEAWRRAREEACAKLRRDAAFEGVGFDIDPAAVEVAAANAKKAGVDKHCRFFTADVARFSPAPDVKVFANPPYGERLGDAEEAARLARVLGERLEACPVRGAYIISSDAAFETHFGRPAARRRKLYNGMIPCQLYMYEARTSAPCPRAIPSL